VMSLSSARTSRRLSLLDVIKHEANMVCVLDLDSRVTVELLHINFPKNYEPVTIYGAANVRNM
jgi:hypothetical protein